MSGDLQAKITPEIRALAAEVTKIYNAQIHRQGQETDRDAMGIPRSSGMGIKTYSPQRAAFTSTETQSAIKAYEAAFYASNPSLAPDKTSIRSGMDGNSLMDNLERKKKAQQLLQGLIDEEAAKAGLREVPKPFLVTSATGRRQ